MVTAPETLADRALCLLGTGYLRAYLIAELDALPKRPKDPEVYRYRRYVQSKLIQVTTQMLADRAVFELRTLPL